jgi:hypothetical protein
VAIGVTGEPTIPGRLRQKVMPFSTSLMPARTFSEVTRLIRPSSSSSPQTPQVEPVGRRFYCLVTSALPRRLAPLFCTDRLV